MKLSGIVRHIVATPIVVVDVLLWRIVVDEEVVMDRTDLHDPKYPMRRNRFGTPGSISDLVTECYIYIYIYLYIYIYVYIYIYIISISCNINLYSHKGLSNSLDLEDAPILSSRVTAEPDTSKIAQPKCLVLQHPNSIDSIYAITIYNSIYHV